MGSFKEKNEGKKEKGGEREKGKLCKKKRCTNVNKDFPSLCPSTPCLIYMYFLLVVPHLCWALSISRCSSSSEATKKKERTSYLSLD